MQATEARPASATAPTCKLLRYRDASGRLCELWVEAECWREIEAYDRMCRRREAEYRKTHTTFTDLGADESSITPGERSRKSRGGYPWEGPPKSQVGFSIFLGSSPTWWGDPAPDGRCFICKGKAISTWTYCLGCDRCGKEFAIDKPTGADLAKRRRQDQTPATGRLKGGRG